MALTPKQEAFVREYLKDLNATQAAIRAGYSEDSAGTEGHRLLKNAEILEAIDAAKAKRAKRVELKADDVLRVLKQQLFVDIAQAYDADGNLLPVHKMPKALRKNIQSIESEEIYDDDGGSTGRTKKVKFWSKDKALELAMRHLSLLNDKVKLDASESLEALILASMKKPEGK